MHAFERVFGKVYDVQGVVMTTYLKEHRVNQFLKEKSEQKKKKKKKVAKKRK